MDLATKFTLSASMLLTGFVIVFAVLFFLIFIIWFYGKIVTAGINSAEKRRYVCVRAWKDVDCKRYQAIFGD